MKKTLEENGLINSSDVSGVITTPKSTCESGVNPARPNSVSPFVKPKLSAGASLPEKVKGACLGAYKEDIVDGVLEKEWIQCTNLEACGKWMHITPASLLMKMASISAISAKSHFPDFC